MRRLLQLLVLLLCFGSIEGWSKRSKEKATPAKTAEENDEVFNGKPMPMKHWIDPDSMVDESPVYPQPTSSVPTDEINLVSAFQNIQEELQECQRQLQTYSHQGPLKETLNCGSPHLKQIIQALLKATSDVKPYTEIELNLDNREVLRKFLEDKANIHDVIEIVKNSITDKTLKETLHDDYWLYVKEKFDIFSLLLIACVLFVVICIMVFEMKTHLTMRQQFIYLLIVAFIVSIPWEWFRLYKKEFAEKQSLMMNNITKHCHTDHELSIAQSFRIWGKSLFSAEKSTCNKYQEALLIDPIWEVPPLKAVSVTITRFIVEPFELFADATGKSFRALFQHLPIQWQPLMFLACLVIIILCLILFSGIRISTPFLQIGLGVDPAVTNASLQRLEQHVKTLNEQNAAAIQNHNPPAIQDIGEGENRNQLIAILNQLNAVSERSLRHDDLLKEIRDFLQLLRPVVEQARQAEAIEHPDYVLVGNGEAHQEERLTQPRRPVQASEYNPTESSDRSRPR